MKLLPKERKKINRTTTTATNDVNPMLRNEVLWERHVQEGKYSWNSIMTIIYLIDSLVVYGWVDDESWNYCYGYVLGCDTREKVLQHPSSFCNLKKRLNICFQFKIIHLNTPCSHGMHKIYFTLLTDISSYAYESSLCQKNLGL
jgi:hypothetical protein